MYDIVIACTNHLKKESEWHKSSSFTPVGDSSPAGAYIATVGLLLEPTEELLTAVNRLRAVEGYDPVEDIEFTVGLNDFTPTHLDNCIEAVVTDTSAPDVDERYTIDLSEEEQRVVFRTLDAECKAKLGRGCEFPSLDRAHRADHGLRGSP